jgi:hypothetical protein
MTPITARFAYTIDDLREADASNRRRAYRRLDVHATMWGPLLVLAGGLLLAFTSSFIWLLVCILPVFWIYAARQLYLRRPPKDNDEALAELIPRFNDLRIVADEQGLRVAEPHATTRFAWQAFIAFYETPSLFILSDRRSTSLIVPHRAFPPDGIDAFRSLLKSKLSDGGI